MKKHCLQIIVVAEGLYLLLNLFNSHFANKLYYIGYSFELYKWLMLPLSLLCLSFLISIPFVMLVKQNAKSNVAPMISLIVSLVVCFAYMQYNESIHLTLTPLNYISVATGAVAANCVLRKGEQER